MTTVKKIAKVGPDGVLAFRYPLPQAEANAEVLVTIEPAPISSNADWISFCATAGSIVDESFERKAQGVPEVRRTFE